MFCDECHKNKPYIYLVKIANGKIFRTHLCKDCAMKFWNGILSFNEFTELPEFLSDTLFDFKENSLLEDFKEKDELVCSTCGIRLSDFCKSGRLGCSACYKSFGSKLSLLLKKIHGEAKHVGKTPSNLNEQVKLELKLMRLQQRLKIYVKKEEYEKAAKARDEISNLEKNISLEVS
ncbi:UvrB/UvrC motif-containing protein [Candidatus Oleimmundimicrobium sp.]|uniref:UvrB/UvrC motif-containing protein n=1 Tax=Candidatus Oleimmundimicrobium sp. TaxID=3060597 RepID=UPI00272874BA|nr:UvrB/UvrC motif-containing protein [Candidatus Oleimmundimicrobium sp.]MDO8885986.1 UvrB/UvrC motif-containing protein [Candidatus Oleimmundimicrobium sp.]